MSENELIIGNDPINGENIMYILPDNLSSIKFVESNTFDSVIIKDCKINAITSLSLSYIFRSMKQEGRLEIIISQPITVMQSLDSKQIEAHCEHVGFEDISSENTMYTSEKNNIQYPTISVVCYKPSANKDNQRIEMRKEVKKTTIYLNNLDKNKNYFYYEIIQNYN